jgi:apolipoprotein N-acyltransferase
LVRSTSSGSTISVDAAGRILPGSLQPYTASYLLTEVTFPGRDLTFYTRYGDWFPVACGVAVLCIVPLPFIRRKSVPAET